MILISVVRLRRRWMAWLVRLALILTLIYVLSAAYHWLASAGYPTAPHPMGPVIHAAAGKVALL